MGKEKNRVGLKFGKLTVVRLSGYSAKWGHAIWECLCDCGKTAIVSASNLKTDSYKKNGAVRSCALPFS